MNTLTAIQVLKLEFSSNQSLMAREIDINRNTLRKYLADTTGEKHLMRKHKGKWQLLCLPSSNSIKESLKCAA